MPNFSSWLFWFILFSLCFEISLAESKPNREFTSTNQANWILQNSEDMIVSAFIEKFYTNSNSLKPNEWKDLWHENSPVSNQKAIIRTIYPIKNIKIIVTSIENGRDRKYAEAKVILNSQKESTKVLGLVKEGNDWKVWFEASLESYQNAQEIVEKKRDSVESEQNLDFLGSMCWIAYLNYQKKNYQESIRIFQIAQEFAKKQNDNLILVSNFIQIGNDYNELGQPPNALLNFQAAFELSRSINFEAGILRGLFGIGNASNALGRYYQARNSFENRLEILLKSNGSTRRISLTHNTLGITYFNLGDYENSLKHYEKSLQIGGKNVDLLINTGFLMIELNKLDEARQKFNEAIQIAAETNRKDETRRSLNGLGLIEIRSKNYDKALVYLNQSLGLTESKKSEESQILINLARVYFFQKNYDLSKKTIDTALKLAIENNFFETIWYGKYLLGKCLKAENNKVAALDSFEGSVETIENWLQKTMETNNRQLFFQNKVDSYREAADLLAQKNEFEKAVNYAELSKAKTLLSITKGLDIKTENNKFSLAELNKKLPDNQTALIEYVVGEDATLIFLITKEKTGLMPKISVQRINKSKKEIEGYVNNFYSKITTGNYDFSDDSINLYKLLIEPVAKGLNGKKSILLIPDGVLWNLPFQALKINSGEYLLEKFSISYSRSLSSYLFHLNQPKKIAAGKQKLLTVSNPITENPLPFAEESAKILTDFYGRQNTTSLIGEIATEEKVKSVISKFDVIHFGTHGFIDEQSPMSSYLQLTAENSTEDGKFEANEIMNLQLNASLVVLAGCETGRGKIVDGEGIIGLTWALEKAGVNEIIVSQWKVKDKTTKELMTEFYRSLTKVNKEHLPLDSADAMRLAALKMQKTYPHPSYWAGFLIIGKSN